jgi:hypothetical protein
MATGLDAKRSSSENADPLEERFDTGQLSLHEGLVRELLQRAKGRPELSELFKEGCVALARIDEASRLRAGDEDHADAIAELVAIHRKLLDQVSLGESRAATR